MRLSKPSPTHHRPSIVRWTVLMLAAVASSPIAHAELPPQVVPLKDRANFANDKMHLGDALFRLEDLKGACQAYREAVDILPSWWHPHVAYVRCARFIGAPIAELLEHSELAVKARPELAEPHYERGLVLEQADRTAEAVAEFNTVLELEPGRMDALYRLGVLLERRGEVDKARAALQRVVTATPGHVMARSLLARLLEETGDLAGARTQLEALMQVSRFPPLAMSRLIRFLERHGLDRDAAPLRAQYVRLYR